METHFLVLGEDGTYFNIELGWVEDKAQADPFPMGVLTCPLPPGTIGVLEETLDETEVRTYVLTPLPPGRRSNLKKSG